MVDGIACPSVDMGAGAERTSDTDSAHHVVNDLGSHRASRDSMTCHSHAGIASRCSIFRESTECALKVLA
jgi:hypothetical protein